MKKLIVTIICMSGLYTSYSSVPQPVYSIGTGVDLGIAVCQGPHVTGYPTRWKFNYQSYIIPKNAPCTTSQRRVVNRINLHRSGRTIIRTCDNPDNSKRITYCAKTLYEGGLTHGDACQSTSGVIDGIRFYTDVYCNS